ncbi:S-layer homology domain-containing protein [Sporosarcina sp. YIM B06819]|uniref:S-layer homology domain-containing protein n=1 Tax=Sporosarcina sp. YIM B06819 TaxID=3081769 RepID=UPI00298BE944|nr:S-layer homology domain-containing protein [Sporosarcina sp. YIM B06819]
MRKFKFSLLFAVTLLLQMMVVPYHFSADELDKSGQTIDYLALGDSLAAGISPYNELGKSYADFLAEAINANGDLKSFNKGFSYPGYKTTDVLNDIRQDVTKEVLGVGSVGKTAKLQQSIKAAELITISAGANDVLPLLKQDPATGKVTVDQKALVLTLQQVGANYKSIMEQINQLNPDAQVYVMGYYNPFPYMSEDMQPMLNQLLATLNKIIAAGLTGTQAILVPTEHAIAADYKAYLPNPENIHLSEAGYKVVMEQFWLVMENAKVPEVGPETDPEVGIPVPALFTDIAGNGLKAYIEQAAAAGIVSGYADGTFKPNQKLTRVQAASMIVQALGLTTDEVAPFDDIANYAVKTKADINAAYKYGIARGKNGKFKPNDAVTRAQLALMIERAYELGTGVPYKASQTGAFTDLGNYGTETVNAISMLHELKIASGFEGKFMPSSSTTRAQAAKMFVNFMSLSQAN